jgi:hypothetical protein
MKTRIQLTNKQFWEHFKLCYLLDKKSRDHAILINVDMVGSKFRSVPRWIVNPGDIIAYTNCDNTLYRLVDHIGVSRLITINDLPFYNLPNGKNPRFYKKIVDKYFQLRDFVSIDLAFYDWIYGTSVKDTFYYALREKNTSSCISLCVSEVPNNIGGQSVWDMIKNMKLEVSTPLVDADKKEECKRIRKEVAKKMGLLVGIYSMCITDFEDIYDVSSVEG